MNKVSHDSEAPALGQQVITACAFIHKKDGGIERVFLPKRAVTKRFLPGKYEIPSGFYINTPMGKYNPAGQYLSKKDP